MGCLALFRLELPGPWTSFYHAHALRRPAVGDDPLPKHEGMAAMENPVSMSSGNSLQDWSSDSISSHQKNVRSPAVQKLQLQLAQALIALSLINYIILFFFLLGM